jgi:hypothetical protein
MEIRSNCGKKAQKPPLGFLFIHMRVKRRKNLAFYPQKCENKQGTANMTSQLAWKASQTTTVRLRETHI